MLSSVFLSLLSSDSGFASDAAHSTLLSKICKYDGISFSFIITRCSYHPSLLGCGGAVAAPALTISHVYSPAPLLTKPAGQLSLVQPLLFCCSLFYFCLSFALSFPLGRAEGTLSEPQSGQAEKYFFLDFVDGGGWWGVVRILCLQCSIFPYLYLDVLLLRVVFSRTR